MAISTSEISCGVYQLSGLNRPSHQLLQEVMRRYRSQARSQGRRNGFAQIIFSDRIKVRGEYIPNRVFEIPLPHGDRFKDYILAEFPNSELVCLTAKRSPSTQNDIRTYIWNIPHVAFKKHKYYPKGKQAR